MAEHTRLASLLVMITAAGFLLGALLFTLANTSSSGVRSPGVTVTGRPTSTVTDPSTAATALPAAEPSPEAPAAQVPAVEAPAGADPVLPAPPVLVDDDDDLYDSDSSDADDVDDDDDIDDD